MAERIAELYVELSARTEKLEAALKTSQTGLSRMKGGLKDVVQGLTGFDVATVGTAAVVGGLAAGLKFAIGQAMEAEVAMAATENAIQATGGAAGLTAEQVAAMAGQMSIMTGIADDVIQSGQNMLLTFKEIKGDTFERATRAITDMAVAMNKGSLEGLDLQSTSIQVGKALNVVAGDTAGASRAMSALQRVGVTFTASQKKAAQAAIELGDVMAFQAIILGELETEFGGAAEAAGNTTAGNFAKLKNVVSELAEELGGPLVTGLNEAAKAMLTLAQWDGQVTTALEEHEHQVMLTAASYDEYIAEIERARLASGKYYRDQTGAVVAFEVAKRGIENVSEAYFNSVRAIDKFGVAAHAAGWELQKATMAAEASNKALSLSATNTSDAAHGYAEMGAAANDMGEAMEAINADLAKQDELLRAAVDAGLDGTIRDAMQDYRDVIAETQPEIDKLNAEIERMNAAHGKTWEVTSTAKHSTDEYRLAQLEAATAAQKLAEYSGDSEEELLRLRIAATNAAEGVAQMGTEMGITEVFTANYTKALQAANGDLGALEAAQASALEQLRATTAEFILQQVAMELDGEAALLVARKLGILSEQDFALAMRVRETTAEWDLNKNGMIDAGAEAEGLAGDLDTLQNSTVNAAERAAGMAETIRTETDPAFAEMKLAAIDARDAINSIPDRVVTVTTRFMEEHISTPGVNGTGGGRATGGPVSPGVGYTVGEMGAEPFVPLVPGFIVSHQDAKDALAGDSGAVAAALAEISAVLQALPANIGRSVRDSVQKAMA